ncbi:DUF6233 domain-containing protein [Streptomyces sp. NPDC013313]|uniref:DUF6233 domain-containing protein n=1 Tax=Streptomyces sp. NPDC013313 TaxID=3155603 RepID=UPI0033D8290A
MAGSRRRPVERDEVRRLLADGTSACFHCRPDTDLGIIGLLIVSKPAGGALGVGMCRRYEWSPTAG